MVQAGGGSHKFPLALDKNNGAAKPDLEVSFSGLLKKKKKNLPQHCKAFFKGNKLWCQEFSSSNLDLLMIPFFLIVTLIHYK